MRVHLQYTGSPQSLVMFSIMSLSHSVDYQHDRSQPRLVLEYHINKNLEYKTFEIETL